MPENFAEEETDAVLLVDAANAFNSINPKVMLHNIKFICPAMVVYTYNCYSTASRLYVQGGKEISSAEGTTQGYPIAVPLYAVAIAPLLQMIKSDYAQDVRHVAFADDLCGAGKLVQLRSWWDNIVVHGPHLCYYPRADKSRLIVKPQLEERAKKISAATDVRISTNGHKYLGGYIGSEEGKAEYVRSLVTRWCDQIHVLSEFAKLQPKAAYAALVSGFCNRFTYYIRTIPGFETEIQQSDNVIDTKLLPALLDQHSLSRHERELLSVPTRLGGLGIPIFSNICVEENVNSKTISQYLSSNIALQNQTPATGRGDCIHDQRQSTGGRLQVTAGQLKIKHE